MFAKRSYVYGRVVLPFMPKTRFVKDAVAGYEVSKTEGSPRSFSFGYADSFGCVCKLLRLPVAHIGYGKDVVRLAGVRTGACELWKVNMLIANY